MGWVCWGGRNWCMEEKVDKSWLSTRGWPAADLDTTPKSKYTNRVSAALAREGGGGCKIWEKPKWDTTLQSKGEPFYERTRQCKPSFNASNNFLKFGQTDSNYKWLTRKEGQFQSNLTSFFCFAPSPSLVRFHSRRPIRISKLCPCESYTIAMLSVCTVWCTFCAILIVHHCTGSIIARLGL